MTTLSVLMAVFNGAPTLAKALDGILADAPGDAQVIVVDDGSTDDTAKILAGYGDPRIEILSNDTSRGLTRSLVRGLEVARGTHVARMDADDETLPGRFAAQIEALENEEADICFGRYRIEGPDGDPTTVAEDDWPFILWRGLFENRYGAHPAAMFRRHAILGIGGYDPEIRVAQDYDLWDRAVASGLRFTYVPNEVLVYADHPGSITRARLDEQRAVAASVSLRALARRFSDASEGELLGLRRMMSGDGKPDKTRDLMALRNLEARVSAFVAQEGGRQRVWRDVLQRLYRRRRDVGRWVLPRLVLEVMQAKGRAG